MPGHGRERQEVVQLGDAQRGGLLEQQVQQVGRGQDVVEGPVRRPVGEGEPGSQRAQPAVGHVVVQQQAPGQRHGVDRWQPEPLAVQRGEGRVEERQVEAHVVADEHRPAHELEQGGQDLAHRGRRQDHRLGDAGELGDERGDGGARVDQRLEGPKALAAPELGRSHLGDGAVGRRPAGRLEVDHAERHGVERGRKVSNRRHVGHGSERMYGL
jgi:hypothetical protein